MGGTVFGGTGTPPAGGISNVGPMRPALWPGRIRPGKRGGGAGPPAGGRAGIEPPGRMVPPMGGTVLAWRPSCLRSEARFVPGMVQPIGCTVSGGTVPRLRSRACGGGLPPDRNGA